MHRPVAAAHDAGDHLDPADIVVGHEHVLKHRLEPFMVMPDRSIKIGAVHQTSSLRVGDGVLHAHSDGSS